MAGDYSRNTFDPTKHYTRVLMQQGRVQLDADWNENADDLMHRITEETRDVVGPAGAPKKNDGFAVSKTDGGDDLFLSPGRMYVDGILCEVDGEVVTVSAKAGDKSFVMPKLLLDGRKLPVAASQSVPAAKERDQWLAISKGTNTQFTKITKVDAATRTVTVADALALDGQLNVRRATTYLTQPDLQPSTLADGSYLAYLDVWEREISALDDPEIREIALGGPDTARRMKTVWQVRLMSTNAATCEDAAQGLPKPATGMLAARTAPAKGDTDPCHLPPTAGYLGLENQLYRVEIQKEGVLPGSNPPTFKWSTDNAALEVAIDTISGSKIEVEETGKDDLFRFQGNQWVEIVDESSLHDGKANKLRQIDTVDTSSHTISLKAAPPISSGTGLKLRGWKQQSDKTTTTTVDENGVPIPSNAFITLEYGVQVSFADGVYHTGDYWVIPARIAEQDILWPRHDNDTPEYQRPRGIAHHYAPLARITVTNSKVTNTDECRMLFPPLTHICAEDVCFDNKNCKIPNAKNVQQAIDALCARRDFDLYKKYLFGYGVVCGLQLVCEGVQKPTVTVKSGYAIDCEGRDMFLRNDVSVDLRQLAEWQHLVQKKVTRMVISMSLGAGGIEFHLAEYKNEGWLAGSPLEKAYQDCQKKVVDYLKTAFKPGDVNDPKVTDSEKRLIAAWNLIVQLYNPQSGKHVYLSEEEHRILEQTYADISKLLTMSHTYCSLGAPKKFPGYPLKFKAATFFGKGDHQRIRIRPDGGLGFVFGGNDRIGVFKDGVLEHRLLFPEIGGGKVIDVAFSADRKNIYVLAESADKSFLATWEVDGRKWSKPQPIGADERIVMLGTGVQNVDVFGLGEQKDIYAIDADTGTAKAVISSESNEYVFEGHFIIDEKAYRCFVAQRKKTAARGKYDSIAEYTIRDGVFKVAKVYDLGGEGTEGISYSLKGGWLLCALIEKSGMKRVVAISGQGKREIPLKTSSAVSITGLTRDNALAAVAIANANVVEFFRFDGRLDRTLPVQIWPSGLAATEKGDLLTVNRQSHTVSWTSQPAAAFDIAGLEKYREEVLNAFRDLVILMIESMKDCLCEHLQPDCPRCGKDDVVNLGAVELDGQGTIRRICGLEKRTWVLTPRNVSYWLSFVPVIPAIRAMVESLCCVDLPEMLKQKLAVPPQGKDKWSFGERPPLSQVNMADIKAPLTATTGTLGKKLPFLFDFVVAGKKAPVGGVMPPDPKDVIGQPVESVRSLFQDAGIPILDVRAVEASPGAVLDVLHPFASLEAGQPVTLVERDGKVLNVVDRPSTRDLGVIRTDIDRALASAEEAKSRAGDVGAIRSEIENVQRRVAEAERHSETAIDSLTTDFSTISDRLRTLLERDTTIRTLTENIDALKNELKEARKLQKDAADRIEALSAKTATIDELKATVDKLSRRKPPTG